MANTVISKYLGKNSPYIPLNSLYLSKEEGKWSGPEARLVRHTFYDTTADYTTLFGALFGTFLKEAPYPVAQGIVNNQVMRNFAKRFDELKVGDIAMVKVVHPRQILQHGGLGVQIRLHQSVSFTPKMWEDRFLNGSDLETLRGLYASACTQDIYMAKYLLAVFCVMAPVVNLIMDSAKLLKFFAAPGLFKDMVPSIGKSDGDLAGIISKYKDYVKALFNEFGKQMTNIWKIDLMTMIIRNKDHYHFETTKLPERLDTDFDASVETIKKVLKSRKFIAYNPGEDEVLEEGLGIHETLIAQINFLASRVGYFTHLEGDVRNSGTWKGNLYKDEVFEPDSDDKKKPVQDDLYIPGNEFPCNSHKQFHERIYHPVRCDASNLVLFISYDLWNTMNTLSQQGIWGPDASAKIDPSILTKKFARVIPVRGMPECVARIMDKNAFSISGFLHVEGDDVFTMPLTRAHTIHTWDFFKYNDSYCDAIYIFTQGTWSETTRNVYMKEPL